MTLNDKDTPQVRSLQIWGSRRWRWTKATPNLRAFFFLLHIARVAGRFHLFSSDRRQMTALLPGGVCAPQMGSLTATSRMQIHVRPEPRPSQSWLGSFKLEPNEFQMKGREGWENYQAWPEKGAFDGTSYNTLLWKENTVFLIWSTYMVSFIIY